MTDTLVESTPGEDNDDTWLYGDGPGELREGTPPALNEKGPPESGRNPELPDEGKEKEQEDTENEPDENDDSHFNDEHFADVGREDQDKANGDATSQGHADSDSDDSDDVKVTIGDIKSGPQAYASLNIKRGVGLVAAGAGAEKARGPTPSKVTLDELEGPGSINGVPALEFNIDTIEDKPWNKPGADISDYFNYGFNEVTWSAYCERQRRMRVNESGVTLMQGAPPRAPPPDMHRARPPGPPRNDDGMQPPMGGNYQVRENTIQVMTAERREYGRAHRDAPPPDYYAPPPDHYFVPPHPHAPYDEPWGHGEQSGWAPSDIKELTPGPMGPPAMGPPPGMGPPGVAPLPAHLMPAPYAAPYRPHPPLHVMERERTRDRDRDRDDRDRRDRDRRDDEDRERDRERSRSIKPDRIREKSYRRERSRSRSRRHKSRSRSPRLRERSRERERERSRDRDRDRSRDRSRDRERSLKPKVKESKEKEEDK